MENVDLEIPEFVDYDKREQGETVGNKKHVDHINRAALNRTKGKIKLRRRRAAAGALIITTHLLAAIMGAKISDSLKVDPPQASIPNGYVLTEITDIIESGDTITDIASEYYDIGTYSGIYPSAIDYTKAILEQNELGDYTTIHPGESITVPVVANSNNEYYIRIQVLKDAIKQIQQTNLWIDYEVKPGDTYSALAAKASGSISETYRIMEEIIRKNKDNSFLPGDIVTIMNPELGPLRLELREMEELFQESLRVNNELKENKTR